MTANRNNGLVTFDPSVVFGGFYKKLEDDEWAEKFFAENFLKRNIIMTEFKVGDWVRHYHNGIMLVLSGIDNCGQQVCWDFKEKEELAVYPKKLTKLYPKFDNFDELFEEKKEESPKPKFEVGERVIVIVKGPDTKRVASAITNRACIEEPGEPMTWLYHVSLGGYDYTRWENDIFKLNDPEILEVGDKVLLTQESKYKRCFIEKMEDGFITLVHLYEGAPFEERHVPGNLLMRIEGGNTLIENIELILD